MCAFYHLGSIPARGGRGAAAGPVCWNHALQFGNRPTGSRGLNFSSANSPRRATSRTALLAADRTRPLSDYTLGIGSVTISAMVAGRARDACLRARQGEQPDVRFAGVTRLDRSGDGRQAGGPAARDGHRARLIYGSPRRLCAWRNVGTTLGARDQRPLAATGERHRFPLFALALSRIRCSTPSETICRSGDSWHRWSWRCAKRWKRENEKVACWPAASMKTVVSRDAMNNS